MLKEQLNNLREYLEDWCWKNAIPSSTLCDTAKIHSIKIYERNRSKLRGLFEHLDSYVSDNDLHMDIRKVRGGTIISLSVRALSESEISQILLKESVEYMDFTDKIDQAFHRPLPRAKYTPSQRPTLDELAQNIAEQMQYKDATKGATRANQSSRQRNYRTMTATYGGVQSIGGKPCKAGKKSKSNFDKQLHEALDGMATATDQQPTDLFANFASALRELGTQMGIGPLQDQLKAQGINWKKSDDNQAIILYVVNANTNAPQPIARISAETLSKPHEFQKQLLYMVDFSRGEAPGAFEQQKAELQAQEKAAREITSALNPENKEMSDKFAQDASTAAATQAAAPKPAV